MRDAQLEQIAARALARAAEELDLVAATTERHLTPFTSPTPAECAPLRVATVLVAEDNRSNRAFIEALLGALSIEAVGVSDGVSAIEQMAAHRFDAEFMDCYMPVLDGFEATRRVRQQESRAGVPRVPIIALTAAAMPDDRQRCLEAGMDEFLLKPFDINDFERVLARVLPDIALRLLSPIRSQ